MRRISRGDFPTLLTERRHTRIPEPQFQFSDHSNKKTVDQHAYLRWGECCTAGCWGRSVFFFSFVTRMPRRGMEAHSGNFHLYSAFFPRFPQHTANPSIACYCFNIEKSPAEARNRTQRAFSPPQHCVIGGPTPTSAQSVRHPRSHGQRQSQGTPLAPGPHWCKGTKECALSLPRLSRRSTGDLQEKPRARVGARR